MRAARIEDGVVVDLWEVPNLDAYGTLYTLVGAPEWVRLGASYHNGVFTNPPAPPPPVPTSVPMSSARIVLRRAGLLAAVEAALAAIPGDEGVEARIIWDTANVVERYSPLTLSLGSAIGLTAEQLDTLFRQAAEL